MPDIITRALLESKGIPTRDIVAAIWGRKLSGGGYEPTEATGTLPLTFRSDGTALIDYRIYGNTVDMPVNLWTATGSQYQIDLKTPLKAGRAYTLTTFKEGIADRADTMYMLDSNNSRITYGVCEHSDGSRIYVTLTPNKDVWRVTVNNTLTDALRMLTEGDTPPDEYISPETTEVQSVGVRTENLFDPNAAEISGSSMVSDYLPLDPSGQYLTIAFDIPLRASYSYKIDYYDSTKTAIAFEGGMGEAYETRETAKHNWQSVAPNAAYAKVTLSKDLTNVLIQNGSTDGAYIPYGYKLPMVSRNDLMGGLPIKLLYYADGTTIMGQGVELTNVPAGAYTIHSKHTSTGRFHDIIYIDQWVGTTRTRVVQSPTREAHTFTLSSAVDRLDIHTVYRPAEGLMESWNDVGYEYVYLTTESTDTPIYIGNTQLMKDEYVSYGEQAIYKRNENNKYNADAWKDIAEKYPYVTITFGIWNTTASAATMSTDFVKTDDVPYLFFLRSGWHGRDDPPSGSDAVYAGHPVTVDVTDGYYTFNTVVRGEEGGTVYEPWKYHTVVVEGSTPQPYLTPTTPPVPLPQLPTFSDADTVLDYEETPAPEEVWVKYQKGD